MVSSSWDTQKPDTGYVLDEAEHRRTRFVS